MTYPRTSAATHVGLRDNNEDAFCVREDSGLFVVADGVGGAEGGEVASSLVVQAMDHFFAEALADREAQTAHDPRGIISRKLRGSQQRLSSHTDLKEVSSRMAEAIFDADRNIIKRRKGRLSQMGSTVAAILLVEGKALVAHVGDSRVYRLRRGELTQITRDHNAMSEMPPWRGGQAMHKNPAYRNQLTRAVGVPGFCTPDITESITEAGDRFLLCTDGLSDVLSDRALKELLGINPPEDAADTLIKAALHAGADDNITVVVVEVT